MATCPALSTGDAFLSTLLRHIDCQAQTLGTTGYQALADPGSPISFVLTTLLTIFIAVFGLRMVLGEPPSLREGVMAIVKIGVVLLIATSWPAYRTLVYDVIIDGPAELGSAIGRPAGLPGADGDLIQRLQASDIAMSRLTALGSGRTDLSSRAPATDRPTEPQRTPIEDDPAFGSARVLFLAGTVAAFAVVRVTAGLLLALAPLFAGLLLFDMARGLFIGWARALIFTMLASLAVTILLGVELALLEPWLAQVLSLRYARIVTAAAPIELLVICLAFAVALAGSLAVIARLAFAIHLPAMPRFAVQAPVPAERSQPIIPAFGAPAIDQSTSRALVVAGAVSAAQRRDASRIFAASAAPLGRRSGPTISDDFAIPPLGQAPRRARPRKSIGAALRDRRS